MEISQSLISSYRYEDQYLAPTCSMQDSQSYNSVFFDQDVHFILIKPATKDNKHFSQHFKIQSREKHLNSFKNFLLPIKKEVFLHLSQMKKTILTLKLNSRLTKQQALYLNNLAHRNTCLSNPFFKNKIITQEVKQVCFYLLNNLIFQKIFTKVKFNKLIYEIKKKEGMSFYNTSSYSYIYEFFYLNGAKEQVSKETIMLTLECIKVPEVSTKHYVHCFGMKQYGTSFSFQIANLDNKKTLKI